MLPAFMNPQRESVLNQFAFTGGGAPAPGRPIAGFPMVKQEQRNWCWAAVASGIDTVRGASRAQCEVATAYAGRSADDEVNAVLLSAPCCPSSPSVDTPAYLDEVLDLLGLSRVPIRPIVSGDGTAAAARSDIAADRPVAIRIDWHDGNGHFIVLVGTEVRAGQPAFVIYDPAEIHEDVGHLLVRSEDILATGYEGSGTWSHVYFIN